MIRVGHGFDAHRLVEGRRLVLGGVTVPSERGALGHSDADTVTHAIADALLGAAALGDIGTHFSDRDDRWKDADSLQLLSVCVQMLEKSGFRVGNIDATIVVQEPRLAPFIEAMRRNLARCCGVEVGVMSVKAKSSEGMGYTGDGTGIAAYAVATIERIAR